MSQGRWPSLGPQKLQLTLLKFRASQGLVRQPAAIPNERQTPGSRNIRIYVFPKMVYRYIQMVNGHPSGRGMVHHDFSLSPQISFNLMCFQHVGSWKRLGITKGGHIEPGSLTSRIPGSVHVCPSHPVRVCRSATRSWTAGKHGPRTAAPEKSCSTARSFTRISGPTGPTRNQQIGCGTPI